MAPPSSARRPAWPWLLLLLLLPMAVALLDLAPCSAPLTPRAGRDPGREPAHEPPPHAHEATPRATPQRPRSDARRATPAAPGLAACTPNARKGCHEGDVWWFDGCGAATDLVEACSGRPCLGVGCAPDRPLADGCGGVPAYGRCTGETASACLAGRLVTIDCAAEGRRCVMTREGARCLKRTPLDCAPADAPTCEGDALRQCVDGRWQSVDCRMRLGRCASSGGRARCVATQQPAAATTVFERCNGADDDLDGQVDEGVACDPVALVAFVAGGVIPDGFDAQLQRELTTLQRVFHPLVFQWVKTVAFSTPAQFDPASFPQLSHALSIAESRFALEALRARLGLTGPVLEPGLDFYIPVLFVASIQTEPPSSGQSTLPNSSCGGVRIVDHPAPPDGLVVVSETRQPETLAHELGHYLGLCHTHDEIAAYGLAGLAAECEVTGDGICDTPWDPGPEQCALLERCGTRCPESGAQPDAANVMSYYMPCRRGLSAEQMAVVEHGLQLRRGWFRCLNPDDCPCLPGEAGACPIAMSCRPEADDGSSQCALDGPALPGAPCGDLADCSGGSMCIGAGVGAAHKSRCVRACRVAAADCACADLGLPFRLCSEDLE